MRISTMREDEALSLARDLHNGTVRNLEHEHGVVPDEQNEPFDMLIEDAREAADELIVMAGFDNADSDYFGQEYGQTVKILLEVVMLRSPQLADRILARASDVVIEANRWS